MVADDGLLLDRKRWRSGSISSPTEVSGELHFERGEGRKRNGDEDFVEQVRMLSGTKRSDLQGFQGCPMDTCKNRRSDVCADRRIVF